ncbi:hypothetical protein CJ030_MR5G008798 [Morella rubra]|uniref:GDSL esterase/lipase n=1 Tax=Morella rubra TaxID=262757 RepID=A0A6A1WTB5_9ROSI|nr:hypothetical protein CJ030_MR5G008798 [Morella rubra]
MVQQHILALQSLGLRKFFVAAVGPLGCTPNQLIVSHPPRGECADSVNNIIKPFNLLLKSLVDQLNESYSDSGSIFAYGNVFGAFIDMLNNFTSYGFTVKDEGCCSTGINPGRKPCVPFSPPCITTRDKYVFWDACHPTQAANEIIARMAYSGPPSDSSLLSNQCKVNGRILSLCCFVKIFPTGPFGKTGMDGAVPVGAETATGTTHMHSY